MDHDIKKSIDDDRYATDNMKRMKRHNDSASSAPRPKKAAVGLINGRSSIEMIEEIAETITVDAELCPHLREDWKVAPSKIYMTENLLTGMRNPYVGIEAKPEELERLFENREKRPYLGMLNACSGSGKSAVLQYCEQKINDANDKSLALALTFNITSPDLERLEPSEGLAMRIAERFLMNRTVDWDTEGGLFDKFREMWIGHEFHKTVFVPTVIYGILDLLSEAQGPKRLLVLVDEPGLSGSKSRVKECGGVQSVQSGTDPELAKKLVEATSVLRLSQNVQYSQTSGNGVRFVFSSLKPVYNNDELQKKALAGGPVVWISVPFFSTNEKMRDILSDRLSSLKDRMSERDFDIAADLIITMASGHWSTFDSIVKQLQIDVEKFKPWLTTVYFDTVRDVMVQTTDITGKGHVGSWADKDIKTFKQCVMLALLGISIDPLNHQFDNGHTLNDLAYVRMVQNRLSAGNGGIKFCMEVPHLSLFEVRRWCLSIGGDAFAAAIREILYSAGHDPTTKPKEPPAPLGIAFERTSTSFLHSKFLSWYTLCRDYNESLVSKRLPLLKQNKEAGFFCGYEFLLKGANRVGNGFCIAVPTMEPRLLYIKGKGGFRSKQDHPIQGHNESSENFESRKESWWYPALKGLNFVSRKSSRREQDLERLKFEGAQIVPSVRNGDIICPGAKNQPHSDFVTVVDWMNDDGSTDPGLIFDQLKFSEGDSSTKLEASRIIAGLTKLTKERGLLYDVDEENRNLGNQISALNVREENVLYCWSVLRETANLQTIQSSVVEAAGALGFRGSILITSQSNDRTQIFGETFKDLVLLHRSRKMAML